MLTKKSNCITFIMSFFTIYHLLHFKFFKKEYDTKKLEGTLKEILTKLKES